MLLGYDSFQPHGFLATIIRLLAQMNAVPIKLRWPSIGTVHSVTLPSGDVAAKVDFVH